MSRNRPARFVGMLVVVGAVMALTYGYTSAVAVPASGPGAGAGSISGYAVSRVHYGLNAADPTRIDSVSFFLDSAPPAGSTIKAKLVAATGAWYPCTSIGTAVTCVTTSPPATLRGADQLTVVVAE